MAPQQLLYFLPLPHGQGSFLRTRSSIKISPEIHDWRLVERLLRHPSTSLRGARFLVHLRDVARSLRNLRLASGRLTAFFSENC